MKILKIIGAAVGAIVAIAVIYFWFADFGGYKPEIEAAVAEATGREFRINGDLEIRALPSPTARMENVIFANAEWSDEEHLLEVGSMSVKLGLWSLLFRPVVVKDFQLHDVTVLLETNEDGKSNLEFDVPREEPPPEEESSETTESPIDLRRAEISNVNITIRQPESDDITLALENFRVVTNDDGQRVIDGTAAWLDLPITVAGTIDDNVADINATFGNVQYRSVTEHDGSGAVVDLMVSKLSDVGDVMEVTGLPAEDLTVTGDVSLRGDTVVFTDFAIGVGTARLTINGEVGSEAALDMVASAPSLSVLSPDLPDIPLNATAKLRRTSDLIEIDPFEIRFGESDIAGQFSVAGTDTPQLTLQVSSSQIDLRPFMKEEESEAGESAEATAESEGEESPYVFQDEPLPLESLQGFGADVDVTIGRVQGRTAHFDDVKLTMDADDGVITLDNSFRGGLSGEFENFIELDASGASAKLAIKAMASDLTIGLFAGDTVPNDQVPRSDLEFDITAAGGSPRQLASSVDGRMLFTQGPGRVNNELIGRVSGDFMAQLFSALNPFSKDEEFSNWNCSILAIDFVSGEGEISGFLLQGEKIMVVGGGEIDLNTEKINIEFNTKPRSGVGVSADMFVTPFVAVSGTFKEPGVGLNASGVLLEGGLAVMTGGLSFLYKGLLDRATAEADQCESTLAEIRGAED